MFGRFLFGGDDSARACPPDTPGPPKTVEIGLGTPGRQPAQEHTGPEQHSRKSSHKQPEAARITPAADRKSPGAAQEPPEEVKEHESRQQQPRSSQEQARSTEPSGEAHEEPRSRPAAPQEK